MRALARKSPVGLSPIVILTGLVMNVEANARTDSGQVAVNIRVWRLPMAGVVLIILRISSSNPLSSILSASSSTWIESVYQRNSFRELEKLSTMDIQHI